MNKELEYIDRLISILAEMRRSLSDEGRTRVLWYAQQYTDDLMIEQIPDEEKPTEQSVANGNADQLATLTMEAIAHIPEMDKASSRLVAALSDLTGYKRDVISHAIGHVREQLVAAKPKPIPIGNGMFECPVCHKEMRSPGIITHIRRKHGDQYGDQ